MNKTLLLFITLFLFSCDNNFESYSDKNDVANLRFDQFKSPKGYFYNTESGTITMMTPDGQDVTERPDFILPIGLGVAFWENKQVLRFVSNQNDENLTYEVGYLRTEDFELLKDHINNIHPIKDIRPIAIHGYSRHLILYGDFDDSKDMEIFMYTEENDLPQAEVLYDWLNKVSLESSKEYYWYEIPRFVPNIHPKFDR